MLDKTIVGIIISAIAFVTVYALTPLLIKSLTKRNLVVKDYNRVGGAMLPRPGGPSILAGILASELTLYAFFPSVEILAIMITTSIAFLVGLADDRKVLGGWFKPLALAGCAIPIILLGAYVPHLGFPLFGSVNIPELYLVLIIFIIPITGNTINSIDVLNGVASGFMTIASFALTISLFIVHNYDIALASLPLGFVSLAFYKYHKFPSKIFPGDSGALTLGSMYGVITVVGHVEIIAAIALLPAVINSFLFLSSVKRVIEHRQIKANPVVHTEDFKLMASTEKEAPITLVRLILAHGPMTEKEIGFTIFRLALFSAALAIITSFMMGIKI
ncbi:MAG: UDP-N-acetylglucosamine-1-phosphate transferase [Thaumarchaeota archaeon 13_1_40CM_38_12]|nr:MAG: UDP-N-acetylglucosamine-1-phosphate transferase [Thaumarchaeota archaeon 13_1_40CM_38_12]OLC33344.1 MAG: UDP-N-acetylglucosamine-1-phosphate transferase [Thaumarchaeota archaeon 13_1_40CM_4_38_7]OLD30344.1 MAG: UDP-N-acetylglucosamine-1-phosphate transferase [Thaumarchaeota archaeon 13_1_40CM_2_39_7]